MIALLVFAIVCFVVFGVLRASRTAARAFPPEDSTRTIDEIEEDHWRYPGFYSEDI